MGAEGVVIGILKPDGTLHMEQMKELMEAAGDMSVTLHRAFDVCVDPIEKCMSAGRRTSERASGKKPGTCYYSGRKRCQCGSDPPVISDDRSQSLSYVRQKNH